jgi:hypothetical protein
MQVAEDGHALQDSATHGGLVKELPDNHRCEVHGFHEQAEESALESDNRPLCDLVRAGHGARGGASAGFCAEDAEHMVCGARQQRVLKPCLHGLGTRSVDVLDPHTRQTFFSHFHVVCEGDCVRVSEFVWCQNCGGKGLTHGFGQLQRARCATVALSILLALADLALGLELLLCQLLLEDRGVAACVRVQRVSEWVRWPDSLVLLHSHGAWLM